MYCGQASLVNPGKSAFRAVTLWCRAWSCADCSTVRARQLVELAQSGKPTKFLTLTVNPATGTSPEDRARSLVDAWRVLVRLICKKHEIKRFEYFCVFEATKAGEPHLHILADFPYTKQKWLSEQMAKLIEAPICDIRAVKSKRHVAFYLAKYVGKDPHHFGTCKRYWTTRHYRVEYPVVDEPDPIWSNLWHVCKWPLSVLAAGWKAKGWDVQLEDGMLVAMARQPTEGRARCTP